ncbi:MAG: endonuclease/exonuclease/phosphatase, partial [Bacteroidales bacterium]|nr:endonuclease/exonuclease/phosphatase [Bacteroidales bacterium]
MKRNKNNIFLLIGLVAVVIAFTGIASAMFAQSTPDFLFMSYNVENLFDTIDNPLKNDNEFLPSAKREWNSYRYQKKLTNISKVI